MDLEPIPPAAAETIEKTRRLVRSLAGKIAGHGVAEIDVLVGIAYGLHDLATDAIGHPMGAIEWQRSAVDLFERQIMRGDGSAAQAN